MNRTQMDEIILDGGMLFLAARRNRWIDGTGREILFSEMDDAYLKNCYNWSLRWFVEDTINEEIKHLRITAEDSEELMEYMLELAEIKANELKEECNSRKII